MVPYTASERDAAASSSRDGGSSADDASWEADGWILRDGSGDAVAGAAGCAAGRAERRVDSAMVVCQGRGVRDRLDACHAAASCNGAGGWRLCSPLEYLARFAAKRPPVKDAWLGGCLFDVSATPPVAFREVCPHCVKGELAFTFPVASACQSPQPGAKDDAESGSDGYETRAKSVGFVSADRCATILLGLDGRKSAYWLPADASEERASAFCCLPSD